MYSCGKTVYFAERISAAGKDYHKLCFKCTTCKKKLEPGKFSEREGNLYCPSCYGAQFQPKGYGFGTTNLNSYSGTGGTANVKAEKASTESPVAQFSPTAPKFCPNCGEPTTGTKFCGNCGTKLL